MATQQTAKTQYLDVDGVQYAYRRIGGQKESSKQLPLLMLNHVRATIDTWDPDFINNLTSSGRQLITYDYAGIGHSSGTVAPDIRGFATNLLAFLNRLIPLLPGNVTQFDVLGFSMGGYVAQQAALIAPHLFHRVVLSGTGPSSGSGVVRPMNEVQSAVLAPIPSAAFIPAFFPSFTTGEQGLAWFQRSISARQGVAGKNGEPSIAQFTTGQALIGLTQAYLSWDADPVPYSLLPTIKNDVLVTTGDNDLIVPTDNSFVLSRQLPRANFAMFPSSGHGHLFQYADYSARLIGDFLDGKLPIAPDASG